MKIETRIENFTIRTAEVADCKVILTFIKELAEYEKLLHEVEASEQTLRDSLFSEKPFAKVIIGEFENMPSLRGKGYGKCLLAYLAKLAHDENYTRVEWSVLDWNKPSIDFYRSIGAIPMDGWTVQRLYGQALEDFAKEFN